MTDLNISNNAEKNQATAHKELDINSKATKKTKQKAPKNKVVEPVSMKILASYLICIYLLEFREEIETLYMIYWKDVSILLGRIDRLTVEEEEDLRQCLYKRNFVFIPFGHENGLGNIYYLVGTQDDINWIRVVPPRCCNIFAPENMKNASGGLD